MREKQFLNFCLHTGVTSKIFDSIKKLDKDIIPLNFKFNDLVDCCLGLELSMDKCDKLLIEAVKGEIIISIKKLKNEELKDLSSKTTNFYWKEIRDKYNFELYYDPNVNNLFIKFI